TMLSHGFCYGSGLLPDTPLNGALGGSVTFTTTNPPAQTEKTVDWTFNRTIAIIRRMPGVSDLFGSGYEERVTLDNSTGSLQLRNLVLRDTGQYRVTITPVGGNSLTGNTTLKVHEPISGATITPTPNPPIIKGRNVTLTCDASGSIITRDWMKDGQHLSAGVNITISKDKKTLFISPVNKGDAGKYLCKLINPVSSAEAEYSLTVNYGPEKVGIINSPNEIEVGQKFTLTCSADSIPTANYTWMHNGTEIPGQSPEFTKEKSEYSDSGNYTCTATNDVTGNKIESLVHKLSVKGKVSRVCRDNTKIVNIVDQAVDCGLRNVVTLLFNGCVKLLDIDRNWNTLSYTLIQSISNRFSGWHVW
uniref:Ig-like domain-containing protein n=1 Tax=Hucho hucho TaxID=62062 RepID=A0A4W5M0F7_9TELE